MDLDIFTKKTQLSFATARCSSIDALAILVLCSTVGVGVDV